MNNENNPASPSSYLPTSDDPAIEFATGPQKSKPDGSEYGDTADGKPIQDKIADKLRAISRLFSTEGENEEVHLQSLEPRVMYDASPLGAAVADLGAMDVDAGEIDPDLLDEMSFEITTEPDISESMEQFADTEQLMFAETPRELIFIDQRIANYQDLVSDLVSNVDSMEYHVVLLDSNTDGIQQISDYLAGTNQYSAIHLVSHGSDGMLQLGGTDLSAENLAQYEDQITAWSGGLTQEADILLYGCEVAHSELSLIHI